MAEKRSETRSALAVLKEKGAYAPSFTPRDVLDKELEFISAEHRTSVNEKDEPIEWYNLEATVVETGEKIEIRAGTKRMRGYFKALQDEFPVRGTFVKVGTRSIDLQ